MHACIGLPKNIQLEHSGCTIYKYTAQYSINLTLRFREQIHISSCELGAINYGDVY